MGELRKDYILNRWVIIASERKKRPHELKVADEVTENNGCFFCPGHESTTPKEIKRVADEEGNWKIRVFPNKFAAVRLEGQAEVTAHNKYFTFSSSFGHHEVIVETPKHHKQLWDFAPDEFAEVLKVYNNRIIEIEKEQGIGYVSVFKNHGTAAGTSLVHSHTQIIATNVVNKEVEQMVEAAKAYDSCPYCEIVDIESKSDRRCFENEGFTAFCPYASRFNFEIWIFPKKHIRRMSDLDDEGMLQLADIQMKALKKLREINAAYNYYFHYSPEGEDLHFHVAIVPRLAIWAGFEMSSDIIINIIPPEDAARFYRGEEHQP